MVIVMQFVFEKIVQKSLQIWSPRPYQKFWTALYYYDHKDYLPDVSRGCLHT